MTATMFETERFSRQLVDHTASLRVERTDIDFSNIRPERLDIRVRVTNVGAECSAPTVAVLSAAPLGAFVPWRPLAAAQVPVLEPGASFVVRAEARRPRNQQLGTPDRIPPRQLLVALGADDDEPSRQSQRNVATDLLRFLRGRRGGSIGAVKSIAAGELPADPLQLLGRENPHWAGNLNIFIGNQSVERHMAQALRVYPECTNMAMFIVGTLADAYAFTLRGSAERWEAGLFDITQGGSLLLDDNSTAIDVAKWIELPGCALMMLAMVPPKGASKGTIEVHVTQRSSGQTAVVEFSLDPSAAGPGCYTV